MSKGKKKENEIITGEVSMAVITVTGLTVSVPGPDKTVQSDGVQTGLHEEPTLLDASGSREPGNREEKQEKLQYSEKGVERPSLSDASSEPFPSGEPVHGLSEDTPRTELGVNDRPVLYGPAGAVKRVRYCGAKRRNGGYCKKPAMANGRCMIHGGRAAKGYQASNFKHGKYSKYLPYGMQKNFERSLKDPELLSLNNELAVIDGRLIELIEKLDKGESQRTWLIAKGIYGELVQALHAGSLAAVNKHMAELGEVLTKGHDEYGLWKEIGEQIDRRRSLAEAERRRLVEAHYMVDVEKAKTLMAALAASVRKHVTDTKALAAISEDFLRLTEGPVGSANHSD
jgi:hypothetical protein